MVTENPAGGKAYAVKSSTSSAGLDEDPKRKDEQSKDTTQDKVVPYFSLYRGIDSKDYVAIFLGLLGSFVNGLTFPAFSFVFAEVRLPAMLARESFLTSWHHSSS